MERFHWLPHEIDNIPYSVIQKMRIIDGQKSEEEKRKTYTDKFKSQQSSTTTRSGQARRFTREI